MGDYISAVKGGKATSSGTFSAENAYLTYRLAVVQNTWPKAKSAPEHPYAAVKTERDDARKLAKVLIDTIKDSVTRVAALGERIRAGTIDLNKLTMYTTEHARHYLADPAVAAYEKGYMASGMDLAKLKEEWSAAAQADVLLAFEDKPTHTDVVLSAKSGASTEPVIAFKVYRDRQRFEASAQVPSSTGPSRQVFRHRETRAEYVEDAASLFVRRFVLRCLNAYDNPRFVGVEINADPRVKKGTKTTTWTQIAQTLPQETRKTVDAELWKHQREKQLQGGSPFVSATTTRSTRSLD